MVEVVRYGVFVRRVLAVVRYGVFSSLFVRWSDMVFLFAVCQVARYGVFVRCVLAVVRYGGFVRRVLGGPIWCICSLCVRGGPICCFCSLCGRGGPI